MSPSSDPASFIESRFSTRQDIAAQLVDRALALIGDRPQPRLLDLGCGSGGIAIGAALSRADLSAVALDVAPQNGRAARAAADAAGAGDRIATVCADYLAWPGGTFDIVVSDSVLHLIPGHADALARRLAHDLKPGGILLATIPIASAGNRLRLLLRRLWSLTPSSADEIAVRIARRLHPSFQEQMLRDRIPYLRMAGLRLFGPAEFASFVRHGLDIVETVPWKTPTIFKLAHHLIVWRRRA